MPKTFKHIALVSAIVISSAGLNSAVVYTGVDTGADFLTYGIGARPSAMGESCVAVYSDVFMSYWNPAGLAELTGPEFGAMHSDAAPGASLEFFGFALPVSGIGVFGVNTIFMLYESEPKTSSESEEITGYMEWVDWSLALSYCRKFRKDLSAGCSVKVIQKRESDPEYGKTVGTAYAGDLGLIYEIPYVDNMSFGFSVLNLGGKIHMEGEKIKDDLPRTFRLGVGYELNEWRITCDFNKLIKDKWRMSAGLEYDTAENLFLRAGYYDRGGNVKGMTYGLGFRLDRFDMGWANVPAGEMIGATRENRVSVIVRF